MSPGRHAAVSAVLAAGVGVFGGDPATALATFVGGTAIDADHLADYFLNHQGKFSVSRFVKLCNQYRLRRIYLFAHALELLIPLILAAFILDTPLWIRGAALGVGVHMLMDLHGNGLHPRAYLLTWRIWAGFDFRRAVAWLPESGLNYWGSYRAFIRGIPEKRGVVRKLTRKFRRLPR